MKSTGQAKSLGAVVGENLAQRRAVERQTQREAAAFLREYGLKWSPANLAQLESGRRASVRMEELVLMSRAYEVDLAVWFQGDGSIDLADGTRITRADMRKAVAGRPDWSLLINAEQRSRRHVTTDPERAAALQLHVDLDAVAAAAEQLWGGSMSAERDRRVGDLDGLSMRSVQARRGHATRALIAELRTFLESVGGTTS